MTINWFTIASLFGLIALGVITILIMLELDKPHDYLVGVIGLGAMTITAAVLSLHFKDN